MNFEKLKRNKVKRNVIIIIFVIVLLSTIALNITISKYRTTQSIPLVNGTINYSLADLNIVAIYTNSDSGYVEVESIPESGYALNEEESYCKVNNTRDDSISLAYDVDTKTLSVTPMTTKGTKCYLYFDEYIPSAGETLLANYSTVLTRDDFTSTVTNTTTGTIYKSKDSSQYDDYGEVYYFAGNPTDNWVYFGGFYWRIIRINGDGTIRMIYQGTSANTTGEGTQIGTSAFNNNYNDNMYVGYMYTSRSVHGLGTSSTIKGTLDNWYSSNLSSYASKIDGNAGFCGDRSPSTSSSSSNGSGGTGTTNTYYGGYIRLFTNKTPTFKCANSNDLYTIKESNHGNKALTYPIGLITADELLFASFSNNNYLYTGKNYWTMTPSNYCDDCPYGLYEGNYAHVYYTIYSGFTSGDPVNTTNGVRPVINLKASVTITGAGTSTNPYTIS